MVPWITDATITDTKITALLSMVEFIAMSLSKALKYFKMNFYIFEADS